MANVFGNPHVIDTTGFSSTMSGPMYLKQIRWIGATTAGHRLEVQDPVTNKVLFEKTAAGTNYDFATDELNLRWKNGAKVTVLGSGKVYFYYA